MPPLCSNDTCTSTGTVWYESLAVVCEYMAEMRGDIKRRPLYVLQCEMQSNIMLVDMERRNVVSHEERPEALSPTRLQRSVPS